MAKIKTVIELSGTRFAAKIRVTLDENLSLHELINIQTKLMRKANEIVPNVFSHGTMNVSQGSLDFAFKKDMIKTQHRTLQDIIQCFKNTSL